jgi:hypothetical protein
MRIPLPLFAVVPLILALTIVGIVAIAALTHRPVSIRVGSDRGIEFPIAPKLSEPEGDTPAGPLLSETIASESSARATPRPRGTPTAPVAGRRQGR